MAWKRSTEILWKELITQTVYKKVRRTVEQTDGQIDKRDRNALLAIVMGEGGTKKGSLALRTLLDLPRKKRLFFVAQRCLDTTVSNDLPLRVL